MGKKRYTAEQIALALLQAESGTSVTEMVRKLRVSEQTIYRWKRKFAGLGFAEV
jgi:putative transposase